MVQGTQPNALRRYGKPDFSITNRVYTTPTLLRFRSERDIQGNIILIALVDRKNPNAGSLTNGVRLLRNTSGLR